MYSRRHGAHSGFVTPALLPVFSDAHGPPRLACRSPRRTRRGLDAASLLGRDADPDALDRARRADLRGARPEPLRPRHSRPARAPDELLQPRLPGSRRRSAQPVERGARLHAAEGLAGARDVARGRARLPLGPQARTAAARAPRTPPDTRRTG